MLKKNQSGKRPKPGSLFHRVQEAGQRITERDANMSGAEVIKSASDGGGSGPIADQLAWVREAIDGLRHSQNIAVTVLGGSIALLVAVFGGFMIWQAGEIKGLGDDMKAMEQRIIAKIDSTEVKLGNRIDGL